MKVYHLLKQAKKPTKELPILIKESTRQIKSKKASKDGNLLIHLSEITPDAISYSFFNIQYQLASIEIKGTAKTRQDLVDFETSLKESEMLSDVNLPLQNLLAQENNSFTIRANINLNKIP